MKLPRRVAVAASVSTQALAADTKHGGRGSDNVDPKQAEAKAAARHIATFDELDYVVFTQQQWERLHESHSRDVITVGHWKDGVMNEEYLFWDNLTFMKQIGLMP